MQDMNRLIQFYITWKLFLYYQVSFAAAAASGFFLRTDAEALPASVPESSPVSQREHSRSNSSLDFCSPVSSHSPKARLKRLIADFNLPPGVCVCDL